MRTMRSLFLLLLAVFTATGLRAQQLPQLSQYVSQDYLYNPAVAGSPQLAMAKSMAKAVKLGMVFTTPP